MLLAAPQQIASPSSRLPANCAGCYAPRAMARKIQMARGKRIALLAGLFILFLGVIGFGLWRLNQTPEIAAKASPMPSAPTVPLKTGNPVQDELACVDRLL